MKGIDGAGLSRHRPDHNVNHVPWCLNATRKQLNSAVTTACCIILNQPQPSPQRSYGLITPPPSSPRHRLPTYLCALSHKEQGKRDKDHNESEVWRRDRPEIGLVFFRQHLHQELNSSSLPGRTTTLPVDCTYFELRHTYSSWFEWRLHLLILQFLPVHVAEEAVLPDVSLPLRTAAQSFGRMLGHQLEKQREESVIYFLYF